MSQFLQLDSPDSFETPFAFTSWIIRLKRKFEDRPCTPCSGRFVVVRQIGHKIAPCLLSFSRQSRQKVWRHLSNLASVICSQQMLHSYSSCSSAKTLPFPPSAILQVLNITQEITCRTILSLWVWFLVLYPGLYCLKTTLPYTPVPSVKTKIKNRTCWFVTYLHIDKYATRVEIP